MRFPGNLLRFWVTSDGAGWYRAIIAGTPIASHDAARILQVDNAATTVPMRVSRGVAADVIEATTAHSWAFPRVYPLPYSNLDGYDGI
jgi:hypothetical protein